MNVKAQMWASANADRFNSVAFAAGGVRDVMTLLSQVKSESEFDKANTELVRACTVMSMTLNDLEYVDTPDPVSGVILAKGVQAWRKAVDRIVMSDEPIADMDALTSWSADFAVAADAWGRVQTEFGLS